MSDFVADITKSVPHINEQFVLNAGITGVVKYAAVSVDIPSLTAGLTDTIDVTVTGVKLGDIVFVEFLDLVEELGAGDEACVVESCKATASVYAPLSGKIKSYNQSLVDEPELINQSPYENGWLFEIEVADGVDESALMDYEAYQRSCDKEG